MLVSKWLQGIAAVPAISKCYMLQIGLGCSTGHNSLIKGWEIHVHPCSRWWHQHRHSHRIPTGSLQTGCAQASPGELVSASHVLNIFTHFFVSVFVLFCSFNHWAGLCWMAECCRSGLLNHQHCSRASRCAQIPALSSLSLLVWWLLPNSLSTFTPMPVSIFCAFCGFVQMLYYLYFPGSQNSFVIFFLFC